MSETWANRVYVREGAVSQGHLLQDSAAASPASEAAPRGQGSAVPSCDAPLHGVMETIQNDAKECLGCLLTLDAGRGGEDSSWELSEGVARLLVRCDSRPLDLGHRFQLFSNTQIVPLLCEPQEENRNLLELDDRG